VKKAHKNANGVGNVTPNGYLRRMIDGRTKLEHTRVAERALGKPLPHGAVVHHVDGNRLNNDPENLVICPGSEYHHLIHQRMNALDACGHASWRKCRFCQRYDDPANLYVSKTNVHHRECINAYYRAKRKEKSRE
jgi:hypothetical protein